LHLGITAVLYIYIYIYLKNINCPREKNKIITKIIRSFYPFTEIILINYISQTHCYNIECAPPFWGASKRIQEISRRPTHFARKKCAQESLELHSQHGVTRNDFLGVVYLSLIYVSLPSGFSPRSKYYSNAVPMRFFHACSGALNTFVPSQLPENMPRKIKSRLYIES